MGLRGPARTPLEIVKRQGNPGHRTFTDQAPKGLPAKKPTPSALVKANPNVLKEWRQLAKWAAELGILRECDGPALEMLAVLRDEWKRIIKRLKKEGEMVTNKQTGMKHVHPLVKRKEVVWNQLWRGLPRFGLTPDGRASLQTDQAPDRGTGVDDWSDF